MVNEFARATENKLALLAPESHLYGMQFPRAAAGWEGACWRTENAAAVRAQERHGGVILSALPK